MGHLKRRVVSLFRLVLTVKVAFEMQSGFQHSKEIYILCRQMYTVLSYLTQFLLNLLNINSLEQFYIQLFAHNKKTNNTIDTRRI
jgi:hypothetical protein